MNLLHTNPLGRLVLLYNRLEAHLRYAAIANKPITMYDLNHKPDVKELTQSPYQVRDVLRVLINRGHVIKNTHRNQRESTYVWNKDSGPFLFTRASMQRVVQAPSDVVVVKPKPIETQAPVPTPAPVVQPKPRTDVVRVMCNDFAVEFDMGTGKFFINQLLRSNEATTPH